MFGNECFGELSYEGTTAAVFMAGLFLSFLVDYLGARFVLWRQNKKIGRDSEIPIDTPETKSPSITPENAMSHNDQRSTHVHGQGNADEKLNVLVLEAGIIFHSLRKYPLISSSEHQSIYLHVMQLLVLPWW